MTIQERVQIMREDRARIEYAARIAALKSLRASIVAHESDIFEAINKDFNKPRVDIYTTEIAICVHEIDYFIKHLKSLMKPKRAKTGIATFPSKGRIYSEPYGVVLIIAPWNFPFQLCVTPLIGAIAAGNAVVAKPASATKNTADIIEKIVKESLPENLAHVFRGNRSESDMLLKTRFDYIFFTGGTQTAKTIAAAAAEHLTPVSLELGGKSPCIVDASANVEKAALRIAWGKFLNAGQVCVAPDYIMVHERVYDDFMRAFTAQVKAMYYDGENAKENFPYVINENKAQEMIALLDGERVVLGGKTDGRKMQPTVVETTLDSPIMQDEIFAPVAPIIKFSDLDKFLDELRGKEKPLAFYYFGKDKSIVNRASFGGGCINHTVMHVGEGALPFGGVGFSGMGRYHEKASFDTFSHYKSVLIKGGFDMKVAFDKSDKALDFLKKFF